MLIFPTQALIPYFLSTSSLVVGHWPTRGGSCHRLRTATFSSSLNLKYRRYRLVFKKCKTRDGQLKEALKVTKNHTTGDNKSLERFINLLSTSD